MLIGQYLEWESHLKRDTIKKKWNLQRKYSYAKATVDMWNKKALEWTPGKEGVCYQNLPPQHSRSRILTVILIYHPHIPFTEWQIGVSILTSFICEKHLHGKFLWCNYCHFHLFWCALSVRNKTSYYSLATQILVWPRFRFDCLSL